MANLCKLLIRYAHYSGGTAKWCVVFSLQAVNINLYVISMLQWLISGYENEAKRDSARVVLTTTTSTE